MKVAVDLSILRGGRYDPGRNRVRALLCALADRGAGDELVAILPDPLDTADGVAVLAEIRAVLPSRHVLVCPPTPFFPDDAGPRRRWAATQALAVAAGAEAIVIPESDLTSWQGAGLGRSLLPVCLVLPASKAAPALWGRRGLESDAHVLPALTSVAEQADAVWSWARAVPRRVHTARRSLAVVSPWPPARSGVADYAMATLEGLSDRYDVTAVADHPVPGTSAMARDEFRDQWWQFDRILYHIGNSVHHGADLRLMAHAPGVVVVHDAVLSGALHGEGTGLGHPDGVAGLLGNDGPSPPPDRPDLRGLRAALAPALGLVLHSAHALELLRAGGVTAPCTTVTRLAVAQRTPAPVRRREPGEGIVLAHFGFVNPFKGADLLIEATGRLIALGRKAEVVFVGEVASESLRVRLHRLADQMRVPLRVTGFVDDAEWDDWLGRVDCAVQLRPQSHGESSAALGELLAAGVPVLCSDSGSFAELPAGVVRHVPAEADPDQIATALLDLVEDDTEAMRSDAIAWSRAECSPARWAADVADTLERAYSTHLGLSWARASAHLNRSSECAALFELRGGAARRDLAWTSDVSVYSGTSFFSGIQRVTSRLHRELTVVLPAHGASLHPTHITEGLPGPPHPELMSDPMTWRPAVPFEESEWLLCLDLNVRLARHRDEISRARAHGLRLATMVYDIIPVTNPEWFPSESGDVNFRKWLDCMLAISDLIVVNSASTAAELRSHTAAHPPARLDPLRMAVVPLGWDLRQAPAQQHPGRRDVDHFLMVGTVEPRKGHQQVIEAFERMWAAGSAARLTVVGRRGWLVNDLVQRMSRLDRMEPRFRWLEDASDADLDALYRQCTAVIMASWAEGFGLPVVEAALRDCPVILRDIPVLREVAGDEGIYFRSDGSDLQTVLKEVMYQTVRGPLHTRPAAHVRTWREVAEHVVALLTDQKDACEVWSPEDRAWRRA